VDRKGKDRSGTDGSGADWQDRIGTERIGGDGIVEAWNGGARGGINPASYFFPCVQNRLLMFPGDVDLHKIAFRLSGTPTRKLAILMQAGRQIIDITDEIKKIAEQKGLNSEQLYDIMTDTEHTHIDIYDPYDDQAGYFEEGFSMAESKLYKFTEDNSIYFYFSEGQKNKLMQELANL